MSDSEMSNSQQEHMSKMANTQKTVHYGWFSPTSKARGNRTHIYLDGSGNRVEVTLATRTTNHGSGWDDLVNVGKVYEYVESTNTDVKLAKFTSM